VTARVTFTEPDSERIKTMVNVQARSEKALFPPPTADGSLTGRVNDGLPLPRSR
jgi:hypothetical protein